MFLDCNRNRAVALQIGTTALVPEIADAVSVPMIAAGGIADGRGIAAFALGASGAQIGTGFLGRHVGAASRRRATCGMHEAEFTGVDHGVRERSEYINNPAIEIH